MHDGLRLADRRSRGKHSAGHAECNAKERQQQQAFFEETSYHGHHSTPPVSNEQNAHVSCQGLRPFRQSMVLPMTR
jgi:hypothetical protein